MSNRGQTTVLFTLIISVLMFFTFSALEVGRIYVSQVKAAAVVQSARLSIMADYNRELFERYHLLFLDSTYGTGSEAVLEEKMEDYVEYSLNEESGNIYVFTIEELAVTDEKSILDNDMELLKEQIESYEKTAGIVHSAKRVYEKLKGKEVDVKAAAQETETNGVALPETKKDSPDKNHTDEKGSGAEVTDPRDTMKDALKFGILSFLKPAEMTLSSERNDFAKAPSAMYEKQEEKEWNNSFQDIGNLTRFLKQESKQKEGEGLLGKAAMLDYVYNHFSNGVNQKEDSVAKCEIEYILKGKDNDYDNLQDVVNEITWLRMPVNYAYLLTDETKKSEALTLAAAICTATGTEALIEVVKYLLLGCWAYGETLCDMRTLLAGGKIPYIKSASCWQTDLKNLTQPSALDSKTDGMCYEDYLLVLLAKKHGKELDLCYARMLDLIEINLRKTDEAFSFYNCVGSVSVQGCIRVNEMFVKGKEKEIYKYYFNEQIAY